MSWARDLFSTNGGGPEQVRARLLRKLRDDPRSTQAVVDAIATVRRELFVPAYQAEVAYEDIPLEIGPSATISAPSMVAEMLSVLHPGPNLSVLEIGAGSGYAAAAVAAMGARVIGVELQPDLARRAQANVDAAGYGGLVRIVAADGRTGWPAAAPYDRILVSASVEAVPQAWLEQLAPGGILVYPEASGEEDRLVRLTLTETGLEREVIGRCRFVRMQL
jgi:protein-L-isoaspartate(D-aspartate) O-methyltransferase